MAFPWMMIIQAALSKKHPGTAAALGAIGGGGAGAPAGGDSGIANQPTLEQLGAAGPNISGGPLARSEMTGPIAMHAVANQPGTYAPASQQFPAATARPYSTLAQAPMSNATTSPFDPTQSRILAQQSYDASQGALALQPTAPPHPAQTYPKWLTNPLAQAFVGRYAPGLVQNALGAQEQEALAQRGPTSEDVLRFRTLQGSLGGEALGQQRTLQDIEQQQAGYNRQQEQETQLGALIVQAGEIMKRGVAEGRNPSDISAELGPLLASAAAVRPSPEGVSQLARFPGQQFEQRQQEERAPLLLRADQAQLTKAEADVADIDANRRRDALQEQIMNLQINNQQGEGFKATRQVLNDALGQVSRFQALPNISLTEAVSLAENFSGVPLTQDPLLKQLASKSDAMTKALKTKKSAVEGVKTVQEFFKWYGDNKSGLRKQFGDQALGDMLAVMQQTLIEDVSPEVADQFQAILEAAQGGAAPTASSDIVGPEQPSPIDLRQGARRRFAVQ